MTSSSSVFPKPFTIQPIFLYHMKSVKWEPVEKPFDPSGSTALHKALHWQCKINKLINDYYYYLKSTLLAVKNYKVPMHCHWMRQGKFPSRFSSTWIPFFVTRGVSFPHPSSCDFDTLICCEMSANYTFSLGWGWRAWWWWCRSRWSLMLTCLRRCVQQGLASTLTALLH